MKAKITLLCLLALLCVVPKAAAQCTFGSLSNSQAYTPIYDGETRIIGNAQLGQYMLVKTFSTATIYTFEAEYDSEYITITDANGQQIFAHGATGNNGINFTPPYPQTVRFYVHSNSQCESNPFVSNDRYLTTTTVTYPCDSPSNLSVSSITSNSATASWNVPVIGINYSYDVYWNTTGVAPVANTTPSLEVPVGTTAQMSTFAPNSTVYYWVRSQCTANAGIWVPGGSFTTLAGGGGGTTGCNGAPYGLYPQEMVTVPCNGTTMTIATDAYAGEYTNVSLSSGQQYTFSSSVSTDYITITDPDGEEIYASGQSPLVWINNSNWGSLRYFLHTNANCGTSQTLRSKFIKCGGDVAGGCTDGDLWPETSFTPACTGSTELIVSNAYAGEYSNVVVTAGRQYTFSSSAVGDYVTIVNPTGNTVLAHGPQPLNWNSGTYAGTIKYYLHTNASCGTQNVNRYRYIQCASAPVTNCGVPSALSVTNITSNSSRLNWTAPATAPDSYDLYIVTTNTAPGANPSAADTFVTTTAGVGVLSGLAASTTYYYWVRSSCSGAKSAWVSGGSFTTNAALTCNGAENGLYPEATFTPACTGSSEQIVSNAYAGEFSNVNVIANRQYTFTSSIATDFVTITNAAGTSVLASGTTPVVWVSGTTTGVVRFFLSANANCGAQASNRAKSVTCANVPTVNCGLPSALSVTNITSNSTRLNWTAPATAPLSYDIYVTTTNTAPNANTTPSNVSGGAGLAVLANLAPATTYYWWVRSECTGSVKSAWVSGGSFMTNAALVCNGAVYGLYPPSTFTPSCTGASEQITSIGWAGEYANVNVSANKQYTFTSSVATDYLTITNAAGTVVLASGTTPVSWSSGTTSGVVRFFSNTDANCGTQNTSRIKSVTCVDNNGPTSCEAPVEIYVSEITSNSCRIDWWHPTQVPTNCEMYISTSNVAPNENTTQLIWALPYGYSVYSELNASTTYYVWVRSACGNYKSTWTSGGSFTTNPGFVCNGTAFGLQPKDTFVPENISGPQAVDFQAMAGAYSNVQVNGNTSYTFSSSVTTDFITITNEQGNVLLATGTSPLTWNSANVSGVVRYFLHANENCMPDDWNRTKYVQINALGNGDVFADNQLKMYPNPTAGKFTVETGSDIAESIVIFDNLGRLISTHKPTSATTALTVDGLSEGIYFVKISLNGAEVTKKLVFERK